jgi:hypothetical protein
MAGATVAFTAATVDGDAIRPGSALLVNNASGAPITLTLVTGATIGSRAVADDTVSVPAGSMRLIGPFADDVYPQASGPTKGAVHVDYSAFASVTRMSIGLNY